MRRRPPRSTRTDTLFPYTTLFRSYLCLIDLVDQGFQRTVQLQQRRIRDGLLATGRRSDTGNHHGACQQYESNGGHQEHLRCADEGRDMVVRSEEHTSELQSLMRISYAVFCLKKKNKYKQTNTQ